MAGVVKGVGKAISVIGGGLFGQKETQPASEPVAPVPDDKAAEAERRREAARKYGGQRANTVLTGTGNKLG